MRLQFGEAPVRRRLTYKVAYLRCYDAVATIDAVLNIAKDMRETNLMCSGHFLLSGIAVGDPDIGAVGL